MKLSKIEVQFNFALFAICLQVAYSAKEHYTEFVCKLREALVPTLACVDDAQNAVIDSARTNSNVSLLQIMTGKPNFWLNATTPRKALLVPEDLFRFPLKAAKLSQETLCGISLSFKVAYVYSDELDLVTNFVRCNPRMTSSDFVLALSSFCSALPGVQLYGLGCSDANIGKFLELPLRDTNIVETLPSSQPRDDAEMVRIGNFFKAVGDDHLCTSVERVRNAFLTFVFTESVCLDIERVFFALGRKLDTLKTIQATDPRSNVLIEATSCFMTAQRLMMKAKSMKIVPEPVQAPVTVQSTKEMWAASARGELAPMKVERRARVMPRIFEGIDSDTDDDTATPPKKRAHLEPKKPATAEPPKKPEPTAEPAATAAKPATKPKKRFAKVAAKSFANKVTVTRGAVRSRKAPERFGH